MVGYFGYGNVAGFLFEKGVMGSFNNENHSKADALSIHPITGEHQKMEANPLNEMTDAEKEEESERLFVLFEKLNRTGVIKAMTPDMLKNGS
jgi:hypothetical protein